jgi:uncharacterized membrane protein (DUF4010 family)
MDAVLIRDFAIALFIGALMGLEREKRIAEKGFGIGGIRTFILLAECGALSAWLSQTAAMPWLFPVALVVAAALVAAGYFIQSRAYPQSTGLTTEVAAVTAFLLGGVTLFGFPELAVAFAILNSALLAYKTPIHRLVGKVAQEDLYAGLKLLVATFIVLPLLPNRTIDPWDTLNPYKAWWLVILISGLSLVGYIAIRWLGAARGTAITGLCGGLVSSTAVSLSFARESRGERVTPPVAAALAAGIVLAWTVMFGRVLVEVAVVHAPMLPRVLVPMGAMGLAALAAAGLLLLRGRRAGDTAGPAHAVPLSNPFSLTAAIKFAAFFTAVMLVVRIVQQYVPGTGIYAVAALAGLTDVDAITLSMAQVARDTGETTPAVTAIVIAVATNTVVKGGIVVALGSRALKLRVGAVTLLLLAVGAAALLFMA